MRYLTGHLDRYRAALPRVLTRRRTRNGGHLRRRGRTVTGVVLSPEQTRPRRTR